MTIILLLLFLLIFNSKNAIIGAKYGLNLWYSNIVPALLPFILISSYITKKNPNHISNSKAKNYLYILILGLLCGCPVGATTIASYVNEDKIPLNIGNYLLPLCNNLSPMFISGLISFKLLNNEIPLYIIFSAIYLPHLLIFTMRLLSSILIHNKKNITSNKITLLSKYDANNSSYDHIKKTYNSTKKSKNVSSQNDQLLHAIVQITYIGIYIMICSIIIAIINSSKSIPYQIKTLTSIITEVTYGINHIAILPLNKAKKIASILSVASFGGISAILQTNKAIEKSRLSINQYIIFKIMGALLTYITTYLLI